MGQRLGCVGLGSAPSEIECSFNGADRHSIEVNQHKERKLSDALLDNIELQLATEISNAYDIEDGTKYDGKSERFPYLNPFWKFVSLHDSLDIKDTELELSDIDLEDYRDGMLRHETIL